MVTSSTSTIRAGRSGDDAPPVILRGTQKGLEIQIEPGAEVEAVLAELRFKLEESPEFFAGSEVIVRFGGEPLVGVLGPLETLTREFDLQIVAVRSPLEDRFQTARAALAVVSELEDPEPAAPQAVEPAASVSIPVPVPVPVPIPVPAPESSPVAAVPELIPELIPEPVADLPIDLSAAELVAGPVRSGCVLESERHLVVFGDVNPGAEVRSLGAIVVLGRLRGVAHAGAGARVSDEPAGAASFILALELSPQQLRIGDLVARAGDAEDPGAAPEVAHAAGGQIIVERYRGRLPHKLWSLRS